MHEYPAYDKEKVAKLTLREVDWMLRSIARRRHEEYRKRAILHGVKLPAFSPEDSEDAVEITDEEKQALDRQLEEAKKEVQKRFPRKR